MRDSGLSVYPALVLGTCVTNVLRFAQTLVSKLVKLICKLLTLIPFYLPSRNPPFSPSLLQLEFMRKELVEESHNGNPFDLQHLKLVRSLREVAAASAPKLVITGHNSLEAGFARELFVQWASNDRNLVLFTGKPPANTLGHTLLTMGRSGPAPPQTLQAS